MFIVILLRLVHIKRLAVIREIQTDVYIKLSSILSTNFPKNRKIIDRQFKNEDKTQKYNGGQLDFV